MKRALILTAAACMVGSVAFAGTQDDAVVALHDTVPAKKATNTCAIIPPATAPEDPVTLGIPCSNFNTDQVVAPAATARSVYLVVAKADPAAGVAGVSCGILTSGGVGSFGFTLCADLDFPNGGWPSSGGGDRITWAAATNCQNTVVGADGAHAVAGSFYIYSYGGDGEVCVTANNGIPEPIKVADCAASESTVNLGGGKVGYGSLDGFNPCLVSTPVEESTWGSIKALGSE